MSRFAPVLMFDFLIWAHLCVGDIQTLYLIAIVIFGFPVLNELKRVIQVARIDRIKNSKKAT